MINNNHIMITPLAQFWYGANVISNDIDTSSCCCMFVGTRTEMNEITILRLQQNGLEQNVTKEAGIASADIV